MKIFISWSGPRSKIVATAMRGFIPRVIQAAKPFLSNHDIDKGSWWRGRLFAELDSSKAAIVCLTPENLSAPWLHYETGAIAKLLGAGKAPICTYLIGGIQNTD